MDKSWMGTNRTNKCYVDGVAAFIDYVVHNLQKMGNIDLRVNKQHLLMPCPCTKYLNHIEHKVEEVQFHLFRNGIDLSYAIWTRHGEKDEPSISAPKPVNATTEFVDDMHFASDIPTDGPAIVEMVNATKDNFYEDDLVKFQELLLGAEKPLYEGCPNFTKIDKKMLPASNKMVEKTYQAKNVMKLMGSGYKNIHAFINNCLIYRKDEKDLIACRTCGISRWKADNKTHKVYENILAKAWRTIDEKFLKITEDPRNLWLGISADGVDVNTGNRHHKNNVADSLVGTLLHVSRKMKDGVNDQLDLAKLGVKLELFAMQEEDKTTLPPAGYTLTNAEKDTFCETLHNIRVPQGYCSNFSSLVKLKDRKLIGLKSHAYHMLMQEFLPIAICSIMHPPTRYAIIRFCFFFKSICSKEIILQELYKMQAELVVTLCLLEKFFPPLFFDIMIHLTVHLTREVKLCGPICFRWMYPFERCMKVIKGHVRNRNKPEGCIAEETIAEETIEFFSEYHKSMETIGIPPDKHETDENEEGKPLSAGKSSEVAAKLFQKTHCKRIAFLENEHSKSFAKWLRKEVKRELAIFKESVSETLRWISYGPRATVVKYDAYNINGYTFHTKCHDRKVYQNSRVCVEAIDLHISKEVNHRAGGVKHDNIRTFLSFCFAANTLVKDFILSINFLLPVWFISCTLHLQLAYAHCICTLHLQLAFASKHLHIAFADCICTLHLYIAFAACICKQAFAHCTCTLHLQAKVLIKTLLKVKQVENKQREKKPRFNKQFL
ncbi:putative transposon, En/Spm-like protein [Tanacetum coccineum]